jgi:quercetin dioxygenase-like cupin family protein
MDIARGRADGQPSQARSDTFTGTVWADPVLSVPGMLIGNVFFAPSGRTYWHSHGGGQVLNVVSGRGLVAGRDGVAHLLEAADVVYARGGEEHWHGAGPDSFILHTAISMGPTTWLEEVGDDDYRAALQRATPADTAPTSPP